MIDKTVLFLVSSPAIGLSFLSMVGLVVQKCTWFQVILGGIKVFIGFTMLMVGIDIIVHSVSYLSDNIENIINVKGYISDSSIIYGIAVKEMGTYISITFALTMLCNLIVVTFLNGRFIFLSGHSLLWLSTVSNVVLYEYGYKGFMLAFISSLFGGIVASYSPALCQPIIEKITGRKDIALGHFCTSGYIMQGVFAKLLGNVNTSTEDIQLLRKIEIVGSRYLIMFCIMFPIYIYLYLTTDTIHSFNGLLTESCKCVFFVIGIFIIEKSTSIIIDSLIPAFKGLTKRYAPQAIPALDCPFLFHYMPNAMILGFIFTLLGSFAGVLVLLRLEYNIIIPSLLVIFFSGATSGIFGNVLGGVRGVVAGGMFYGILITLTPTLLIHHSREGFVFSDSDIVFSGIVLDSFLSGNGHISILIILGLIVSYIYLVRHK
ncbi:PTS transporter subunit IIC [Vibrio maritimus]|uniref:PTS transporter subunit IIC n=1 Tax=Vibrio maritimus TaxID=990268 RepID=UPI001F2F69C5|nr:PTS transporter subunit IIC [Vibrio maritimus]